MAERLDPPTFNACLEHPTVLTAIRFFGLCDAVFDTNAFVDDLSRLTDFPVIRVRELLHAANAAGLDLDAGHASLDEASALGRPILTFLKRPGNGHASDLTIITKFRRTRAMCRDDRFGQETIAIRELRQRWTGIVIIPEQARPGGRSPELMTYRQAVSILPDFIGLPACGELIAYCENECFERSRVVQRSSGGTRNMLSLRARSSASVVLRDRSHPILRKIYDRCAFLEGVPESNVEQIQCVRYKNGQKFRSHFDAGVALPRRMTYLLYLNDGFTGGETYFPLLDLAIAPRAGACLRFPSCDRDGRVLWPSEHGGLPVRSGVKYALNIWVHCASRDVVTPQPA